MWKDKCKKCHTRQKKGSCDPVLWTLWRQKDLGRAHEPGHFLQPLLCAPPASPAYSPSPSTNGPAQSLLKLSWCCLLPQPPLHEECLLLPPSTCTECLLLWEALVKSSSAFTFPAAIPVPCHQPGQKNISQHLPSFSLSVLPQAGCAELHQHLRRFCSCLNGNWEHPQWETSPRSSHFGPIFRRWCD